MTRRRNERRLAQGGRTQRRLALRALAAMLAAASSGCIGLPEAAPHTSYVLRDAGASSPVAAAPRSHALLVASSSASAFLDGTEIAYSREPGALAYYRFASWTERPAERIGHLLQRRLAQTRAFRDVAATTAAVQGEWLLEIQLEEMFHDDVAPPGVARVSVFARLVDRARRRTLGSRRFMQAEPLAVESAAGAVRGFESATTRLLDEIVAWVLAQALASDPRDA